MVRVLLCHHFKSQRTFSESYQPTSLSSTPEFLFIGVGGCRVFVYSIEQPNFPLVCQFSTISTAVKLICNDNSDYIATIERRQQRDATKFARVYFNWDKAIVNEAVQVLVAGHSSLQRNTDHNHQFVAIELPSQGPVTNIATCRASGNVIITTEGKLCLYRQCVLWNRTPEADTSKRECVKISDFEHFLDIEPGFVVRGIDICGPFVAFRSKLEVRVIKLVFSTKQHTGERQESTYSSQCSHSREFTRTTTDKPLNENSKEVIDENCTFWSFGTDPADSFKDARNHMFSECSFRTIRLESTYRDTFLDPKEIFGPLLNVKGHPIKVVLSGRFGIGIAIGRESISVQAMTMLYRRFRAENLCNSDNEAAALHSLQLLPTYTRGLELLFNSDDLFTVLAPCLDKSISLCGVCLLVSGPKEGFVYDVFHAPRRLSVYKYTRDTLKVSVCHTLLHAITKEGLETYTVRMFAAASESVREKEALRLQNMRGNVRAIVPDDKELNESSPKHHGEGIDHEKILEEQENTSQSETPSSASSSFRTDEQQTNDTASFPDDSSRDSFNNSFSSDSKKNVSKVTLADLGPLEQCNSGQIADDRLLHYLQESLKALPMKELPPRSFKRNRRIPRPSLPITEESYLKNLCPPSTLDICLIGMYPFAGPSYVMCSESSVVLFTRATRALAAHTSRSLTPAVSVQSEWSIYSLQNMDPVQLYKAIMPLANRCQKPNRQAFHHLVCEQHLFLRSCFLSENDNTKMKKKIKKLLSESAANLGDLYTKANKEQLTYCAEYYDMSELPFHDIVSRAWKLGSFGEGLANYLDRKLLGSDEPVVVSEGIAKKIFKIYARVNPTRVSEVILMSSLTGFSPETSIAALEELKKAKTQDDKIYRFSALDNLVSVILYLNQCEPDHAQAALSSIPESELIETVVSNSFLLHGDYQHLTPLAQMLRKHKPAIFLEILLRLHDTRKWSLELILNLIGANRQDVQYNYQVAEFLEAILNDKRRFDSFSTAVDRLSNILLSRLSSPSLQKGGITQANHQHIPKGDGYFSDRYVWLNRLPPYSDSSPSCKNNFTTDQLSPRTPRYPARPVSSTQFSRKLMPYSSSTSGVKVSPGSSRMEGCPCCCCTENLLKLQSLLSSSFTSSSLCESLLSNIQDKEFQGDVSIMLLCYPKVGKFGEATTVILDKCPHIMIPFGELFFKCDVSKWSHLLNVVLQKFKFSQPNEEAESRPSREAILAVLKGALSKLAQLTSPQEFLSLLPEEGALGFFLPYLEQSVRQRASNNLCVTLTTDSTETPVVYH